MGWPGNKGSKTSKPATPFVTGDAKHLTKKQIRLLLQLCHPDFHDNSKASIAATEMLIKYPARDD